MVVGDLAAIDDLLHIDGKRFLHGKRLARIRHQPRQRCRHILRQKAAVRAGIGDEPFFVKTLGIIQGLLCRKPQQAVGISLECCQVIELRWLFSFLFTFYFLYTVLTSFRQLASRVSASAFCENRLLDAVPPSANANETV